MSKKILCKKLEKELPALQIPPMPGPKGIEIMNTVSEEAWEMWKSHQTTLINEKRLDMSDPNNRKWLLEQMEKFFNNEDYESASGFKALD
ncbi:MAG: oxidative damage protection protein [Gammaproteobacteria bacterium]